MRTLFAHARILARLLSIALLPASALANPAHTNPAHTSITLHPAVRIDLTFEQAQNTAKGETPMSLTLASIASVVGIDGARLGELIIIDDLRPILRSGASSHIIGVEQVRAALEARNVNWGRVSISGSETRIELPAAPLK